MQGITIIQDYVRKALAHNTITEYDDGSVGIVLDDFPEVPAFGDTVEEAACNVCELVEETVLHSLEAGQPLPPIDGMDVNGEAGQVLAQYHPHPHDRQSSYVFEDEAALMEALRAAS